ncbi:MAG: hypothetical protein RLN76_00155 [Phycisphaeraceae bacterium]
MSRTPDQPTPEMPAGSQVLDLQKEPRLAGLAFILLLLGMTLLVSIAVSSSLWDRDEARFARATVEMLATGDYLVPTFNSEVRPDKPAGVYWAMVLGLQSFGETEIAFRLSSIIGVLWAALSTYFCGVWISGRGRAGVISMLVMLTSIMPLVMGTLATADGLLLGCMTQACAVYVHRVMRGPSWWQMPVLLIALTAGQLVKGPIALAVPLTNMLFTGWMIGRHQRDDWRLGIGFWVGLWATAALSLILFLVWLIPANGQSQGAMIDIGLGRHVVDRMVSPQEGHGGSTALEYVALLPVYIAVVFVGLMPWTAMLPSAINGLRRREILTGRGRALLWGWILPTLIVMSLIATKLPHYVLPIWPGLALLVGIFVDKVALNPGRADNRFARLGRLIYFLIVSCLGLGLIWFPQQIQDNDLAWRAAAPAVIILLLIPWVMGHLRHRRLLELTWLLGISTPIVVVLCITLVLPWVERTIKVSPEIAAAVCRQLPEEAAVYTLGYREPSLIFYLSRTADRPVQRMERSPQAIEAWADSDRSTPEALVITTRWLERLDLDLSAYGARLIDTQSTWNYSSDSEGRSLTIQTWLMPVNHGDYQLIQDHDGSDSD